MKIEKLTRKSHYFNEDRCVLGDKFFMVLDGATALQKTNAFKPTEASWLVSFVKSRLTQKTDNVFEKLSEISKKAYQKFYDILSKNNLDISCLSYYPSAGISFAEIKGDKLEVYTIGDCEAFVKLKSGKTERLIQPVLPELDKKALEAMLAVKKLKNITMKEAVKECRSILMENRKLMNAKNGYSVYTISKSGSFNFLKKTYVLEDIEELYLYTDGIAQAFDELKIYSSCEEMFSKSIDIKKEVDKIVKKAYSDKDCERYPRFKTLDDISIIKINF